MTAESIPVAPLSIWQPIHLGTDETGRRVEINLAERNMLIGGEPGGGKSVALQLIVAHGALSADCRLILMDGKRVELGLWRECAEQFVGPSMDDAIAILGWLQDLIDERTDVLLTRCAKSPPIWAGRSTSCPLTRSPTSRPPTAPGPAERIQRLNRDVVARGRAPGIIPVEATQRPSADIIPTSLRDLFGYRWAFRCSTEASSDTILGHGWANRATRLLRSTRRPAECPGCGPRTAFPAGSKPRTSPTSRSSNSRPGPPTPGHPPAGTQGDWRQRHPAAADGDAA